jgi:hypothetical protein
MHHNLASELAKPMEKLRSAYNFSDIIGNSRELKNVLETIGEVANTQANILILGESGTGKGGTASTDFLVEVQTGKVEVTFEVKVPTCTPTDDVIYLAGSFNFWDSGPGQAGTDGKEHDLPMTDIGNNTHNITLSLHSGESIEYKYTCGSWETVEKGPQGEEISNRILTIADDNHTQHDTVTNWRDIPVTVPPSPIGNIPEKYFLSRNYLNPFNIATTIKLNIPKMSHIIIKIYDILGHEVNTLVDAKYQAGSHSVVWDALDEKGIPVISGKYMVRMHAGEFVSIKKMILMKELVT